MLYYNSAVLHIAFDNGLIACVNMLGAIYSYSMQADYDLEDYKSQEFQVAIWEKSSNRYLPIENFIDAKCFYDVYANIRQEDLPTFLTAVKNITEEEIRKKG